MPADDRELLERDVRALCAAGDHRAAATRAIQGYGPELYGFLMALHHDEQDANDVFAVLCESLWRGLPAFAWGSSLRTWAYTIARNASLRYRQQERRRGQGAVPLSGLASQLAADVRTRTRDFVRTENKDKLAELRDSLAPEDRMLLVLRVDRELAWSELAQIMLGEETEPEAGALKREAARLRKRFQIVKEKLIEIGRREGLLPGEGER
jgi:RNA polymerase sigma-70 factor (ECF subfamily)